MNRVLLAFCFLWATAIFAAGENPADCTARLHALSNTLDAALIRTKAEYGDLVRGIQIQPVPALSGYKGRLVVNIESSSGKVHKAGSVNYDVTDGRLSLDVNIEPNDQEVGLNKLLLLEVLKRHPDVQGIHSYLTDKNASAYLVNLALSPPAGTDRLLTRKAVTDSDYQAEVFEILVAEIKKLKSGEAAKKFRQRMLDSYVQRTPAGRTAQAGGFNKIISLVYSPLSPEDCGLAADVDLGPTREDQQARVFIEFGKRQWMELMPNGEVKSSTIDGKPARP